VSITQAYWEQTRLLGWDNFLRGRISKLRGIALIKHSTSRLKALISFVLDFSLSLWKFRNGVLHGHSVEEMESKERERLFQEIRAAYDAYHLDHFIIPDSSRHIFTSKTLKQILNRDHDSLQCWLRSYNDAVATQKASNLR
jgi:hypothetical protein